MIGSQFNIENHFNRNGLNINTHSYLREDWHRPRHLVGVRTNTPESKLRANWEQNHFTLSPVVDYLWSKLVFVVSDNCATNHTVAGGCSYLSLWLVSFPTETTECWWETEIMITRNKPAVPPKKQDLCRNFNFSIFRLCKHLTSTLSTTSKSTSMIWYLTKLSQVSITFCHQKYILYSLNIYIERWKRTVAL